jgi:signal transduction histidine kinase
MAADVPTSPLLRRARLRLTAWYLAILACSLVVLGTAVYIAVRAQLINDVDSGVRLIGARAENDVLTDPPNLADLHAIGAQGPYDVVVVRRNLTGLGTGDQVQMLRLPHVPALHAAGRKGRDLRTIETSFGEVRLFTVRMSGPAGIMFVQVARSLEPEQAALQKLFRVLLLGGLAGLCLAGLGGWFLAGKSLAPIQESFERQRSFAADASHELRTPLAVIRANAEFLETRDPGNQEAREIVHETDRLTALVTALLALARGDRADERVVDEGESDLGTVTRDAAESLQPLADERGVALEVEADDDIRVAASEDTVRQLTVILVDNAIRYTNEGGTVDVTVRRRNGDGVIEVRDTGIGIAADALPKVFERFYRADAARNRDSGGVGLGLAIARELVTARGGSVEAESAPGEGSTFTARLPLAE